MTQEKPTTHDYAKQMRQLADWLESRPAFELNSFNRRPYVYLHFYDKEQFLVAARAIGAGKKEFTQDEVRFGVELPFGEVKILAPRNSICRLVRPAEYDCDPFLAPEEEMALSAEK